MPTDAFVLEPDLEHPMPLHAPWRYGANTCHAPLWFRDDLLGHLQRCRDELGFWRVRAHGTIGDGMRTVDDRGRYTFDRVVAGLDRLVDAGYTPFVELSHMPAALARDDKHITAYKFRSGPPTDWGKWRDLIAGLVAALQARYGRAELRRWDFEVWNEPDLAFWTGTRREYFRLYDLAADAIKSADAQLRVGGPATARTRWVGEFLDHVTADSDDYRAGGRRCDFVATHAYPSDVAFVDAAEGEVKLQASGLMRELFARARREIDARVGPEMPLVCGEWNSSAGPLAENHDTCNNAAFVAKTMAEFSLPLAEGGTRPIVDGQLYWNLSDIYEECGFHHEPFHGGYGLLTVHGVPKAAFHAFALLAHHAGRRLAATPRPAEGSGTCPAGLGALCSLDAANRLLRATIYHHREPGDEDAGPVDVLLQLPEARLAGTARVTRVSPGAGSAYEVWENRGRPQFADARLLADLHDAAHPTTAGLRPDVNGRLAVSVTPGTICHLEVPID